jgi:hypothetical protein
LRTLGSSSGGILAATSMGRTHASSNTGLTSY